MLLLRPGPRFDHSQELKINDLPSVFFPKIGSSYLFRCSMMWSPMHNLTHWRSCNSEGNSCTVETLHYGQDYEKSNVSVLISTVSTACPKKKPETFVFPSYNLYFKIYFVLQKVSLP